MSSTIGQIPASRYDNYYADVRKNQIKDSNLKFAEHYLKIAYAFVLMIVTLIARSILIRFPIPFISYFLDFFVILIISGSILYILYHQYQIYIRDPNQYDQYRQTSEKVPDPLTVNN